MVHILEGPNKLDAYIYVWWQSISIILRFGIYHAIELLIYLSQIHISTIHIGYGHTKLLFVQYI